ncbi:MAG: hypothetical protein FJX57_23725, partial [Alphaproteobacteria bacterium]|nr:hypothetical protein [Alphaproteobacteria bacterium]
PAGHAGFFLWGNVPEPWTLHRGIRALPAGTSLWLDAGGRRREDRHFDLAAVLREGERAPREDDGETLHEALADTVSRHLIADVPVGVFLSAGLDSTPRKAARRACARSPWDSRNSAARPMTRRRSLRASPSRSARSTRRAGCGVRSSAPSASRCWRRWTSRRSTA